MRGGLATRRIGLLGRVKGLKGFHNVVHHEEPRTWSSVVLYRFESALVFYNASYFKKRVLEVAAWRPDQCHRQHRCGYAGSIGGGPSRARDPPWFRQPPHRGAGLAGTLRRESGARRGGPLPHSQISCGELRARQLHGSIWRTIRRPCMACDYGRVFVMRR